MFTVYRISANGRRERLGSYTCESRANQSALAWEDGESRIVVVKESDMTLDAAIEAYQAEPMELTARVVVRVARRYHQNEMIGDDTLAHWEATLQGHLPEHLRRTA